MMPVVDNMIWRVPEIAKLARISPRQLQWWDEQGLVSPRHHAHKRLYQAKDVLEIIVVAELRRKGLPLQRIGRLFRHRQMGKRLNDVVAQGAASDYYLLTDGRALLFTNGAERAIEVVADSELGMYVVSVGDCVQRLVYDAVKIAPRIGFRRYEYPLRKRA